MFYFQFTAQLLETLSRKDAPMDYTQANMPVCSSTLQRVCTILTDATVPEGEDGLRGSSLLELDIIQVESDSISL